MSLLTLGAKWEHKIIGPILTVLLQRVRFARLVMWIPVSTHPVGRDRAAERWALAAFSDVVLFRHAKSPDWLIGPGFCMPRCRKPAGSGGVEVSVGEGSRCVAGLPAGLEAIGDAGDHDGGDVAVNAADAG